MAATSFSTGSSCCSTDSTNTARPEPGVSRNQLGTQQPGRPRSPGGRPPGCATADGRRARTGRLAHARLGLAQHVHAQDCLRDALVLHCAQPRTPPRQRSACGWQGKRAARTAPRLGARAFRGVLKAAVDNRTQQLRLQQKVLRARDARDAARRCCTSAAAQAVAPRSREGAP